MVPSACISRSRWNKNTGRTELTTVTSIDGFRLIAERTGRYSPGRPTEILSDADGNLTGATVFVKKLTSDGTWHEVSETAFLCEYKPKGSSHFWENMPSVMISKVAEVRALRRAFPDTFSGLYGEEEMAQAVDDCISKEERNQLYELLAEDSDPEEATGVILKRLKISSLDDIKPNKFQAMISWLTRRIAEQREKEETVTVDVKEITC